MNFLMYEMGCLHLPKVGVSCKETQDILFHRNVLKFWNHFSLICFHLPNPNPAKQSNESFLPVRGSELQSHVCDVLLNGSATPTFNSKQRQGMGGWDYSIRPFNNICRDLSPPGSLLRVAQPFPRRGRTGQADDLGGNCSSWAGSQSMTFRF